MRRFTSIVIFVIALHPAALLRGRVIDDLAAPLPNAIVEIMLPDSSHQVLSARTDDRGSYVIAADGAQCPGQIAVRVRHIGFRPAQLTVACSTTTDGAIGNVQLAPIAPVPAA